MTVLVATTVAPYKVQDHDGATPWIKHLEAWKARGHGVFVAAEAPPGQRAWDPRYEPLAELLELVDPEVWFFSLDDGVQELTSHSRLVRICTGRNLALEFFCNRDPARHEAVLFLDTDVEPPEDAPERLLEVDRQLVGFNVPTYCLDGPTVSTRDTGIPYAEGRPHYREGGWLTWLGDTMILVHSRHEYRPFPAGADVREHWNTAGALMVRREAARVLRWRWDLEAGLTDDPCFQADAVRLGFGQTWVRHDVVGRHHPDVIYPLEARGLDLSTGGRRNP